MVNNVLESDGQKEFTMQTVVRQACTFLKDRSSPQDFLHCISYKLLEDSTLKLI